MAKKIKFRESVAQYEQLSKEIKARKFASIYLLMGEDGHFIDCLTDLLAESILLESERAFNQIVVYGKDTDEGTIINHARQMPMMGSYQVVIVKEAAQLRKIDTLSLYAKSPSPTTILVVAYKGKSIDKRTQFYKIVAEKGIVFESAKPYDSEIGGWLSDYIKKMGCTVESKALKMLTDFLGTDISKITNELSKLMTSLPEGTTSVTAQHIEDNIGISKDFNNFELLEAIAKKNMAMAMRIADHFARNPKNNPMVVTIITLFNYFQKLFIINYKRWLAKHKGVAMPSDNDLAASIKVNPFLLGGYKQAASLYPNNKIFAIFGLIREYDMKSKGIGGGSANEGELLRELLMKIFML